MVYSTTAACPHQMIILELKQQLNAHQLPSLLNTRWFSVAFTLIYNRCAMILWDDQICTIGKNKKIKIYIHTNKYSCRPCANPFEFLARCPKVLGSVPQSANASKTPLDVLLCSGWVRACSTIWEWESNDPNWIETDWWSQIYTKHLVCLWTRKHNKSRANQTHQSMTMKWLVDGEHGEHPQLHLSKYVNVKGWVYWFLARLCRSGLNKPNESGIQSLSCNYLAGASAGTFQGVKNPHPRRSALLAGDIILFACMQIERCGWDP